MQRPFERGEDVRLGEDAALATTALYDEGFTDRRRSLTRF
jgi:hypothetical protein